jgi:trans-2,3-dihydro-3-hydroxyanthranilate isomerase
MLGDPLLGGTVLDYWVVDVFADAAFAGNPLAVVLDADDLSTEQMQAMALEFNLSETTFPVRTSTGGADYRLRIFTPTNELPFAGHPSVGTAWLMHSIGRVGAGRVVQECGAGLLPLEVRADGATLTGGQPTVGETIDPAVLLAATGLEAGDFAGAEPRWAGTGLNWAFLHVSEEAVARARPDLARLTALTESGSDRAGVSVLSWKDGHAHARVFAGGFGVPEDPATGSAALGMGVWLVTAGLVAADGESAYQISQGLEMGRPSRLSCTVVASGGQAVECRVSGSVVPVARGQMAVPAR